MECTIYNFNGSSFNPVFKLLAAATKNLYDLIVVYLHTRFYLFSKVL